MLIQGYHMAYMKAQRLFRKCTYFQSRFSIGNPDVIPHGGLDKREVLDWAIMSEVDDNRRGNCILDAMDHKLAEPPQKEKKPRKALEPQLPHPPRTE